MLITAQVVRNLGHTYSSPHSQALLLLLLLLLVLVLLLFDMDVSCHRPFLPGTSLEPPVIHTSQASRITLQYFPYYV